MSHALQPISTANKKNLSIIRYSGVELNKISFPYVDVCEVNITRVLLMRNTLYPFAISVPV